MLESTFKVVVLASQLLASTTMYFLRHYIIIIMYTTLKILTRNKIYTSDHHNLYSEIKFDYLLYNCKGIPLQMAFMAWYKG